MPRKRRKLKGKVKSYKGEDIEKYKKKLRINAKHLVIVVGRLATEYSDGKRPVIKAYYDLAPKLKGKHKKKLYHSWYYSGKQNSLYLQYGKTQLDRFVDTKLFSESLPRYFDEVLYVDRKFKFTLHFNLQNTKQHTLPPNYK